MPDLVRPLDVEVSEALRLVRVAEVIWLKRAGGAIPSTELTMRRLLLIYEMAYITIFCAWEAFLDATFIRYLCGYRNSKGQQPLVAGAYSKALSDAQVRVYGPSGYVTWHNPAAVEARSKKFFKVGPHEVVCTSSTARLEAFGAIRHHVAHRSEDTRTKYGKACMTLAGRRYPGSHAGRFLSDWTVVGGSKVRWVDAIGTELISLARQIAP